MSPQFPSSKPRTPPPGAIQFRKTLPFPAEKESPPDGWSRGKKALLCSVIWLALFCGAAILHTNGIVGKKPSQAEDAALSERYGMICGAGLVVIVAVIFFRGKSKD